MKIQDLLPRMLYLAKLSFRVEGQIKSFPDKNKLKEFINTKLLYRKCWRDFFKNKQNISKTGIKNGNNYIPINKYFK